MLEVGWPCGDGNTCANLLAVRFIPTNLTGDESMFWKIVLGLGSLGIILGIAIAGICAGLAIATDGRVSWEEVAIPLAIGILVLVVSFFVFLIGVIFLIVNRRRAVRT
jgi:hypothetical protein